MDFQGSNQPGESESKTACGWPSRSHMEDRPVGPLGLLGVKGTRRETHTEVVERLGGDPTHVHVVVARRSHLHLGGRAPPLWVRHANKHAVTHKCTATQNRLTYVTLWPEGPVVASGLI